MSENLIEGLVGGAPEDEAAAEAAAGVNPVAAALTVKRRRAAKGGDEEADRFLQEEREVLKKQEAMLDLQIEHMRDDKSRLRVRRWRESLQFGLQVFVAVAATIVGGVLLAMLISAFNSQEVIVDSFDAPPAMAQSGLTGKVVAAGVLDNLTRLQSQTRSITLRHTFSNAWSNDIKVEVPETGVSVGEIDRFLKERFGHDVHIGGSLIQTRDGGLSLTVRGSSMLPKTFTGGADDLPKLTTQAAEYLYGVAEPVRFDGYLILKGRNAEAVAFAQAAYAKASTNDERAYLLNNWATALGDAGGDQAVAAQLYRKATVLKPDDWSAYANLSNSEMALGHEEAAWRAGQAMTVQVRSRHASIPDARYQNLDTLVWNLPRWLKGEVEDAGSTASVTVTADTPTIADIDIRLHDDVEARVQTAVLKDDPDDPTIAAMHHFVLGRLALEAGDAPRAANELEAFEVAFANPVVNSNYPGYNCWVAPAEEAAGHPEKADALLAKAGTFVDCYRFKADILDHRGDWAGAQKQYAAAVTLAPDLPAGYFSWGQALRRHGDLNGAVAKFAAANQRGPHWADPLAAWGDVLAQQGKWSEALAKYDEALKSAPAWPQLHRARAFAARRAG